MRISDWSSDVCSSDLGNIISEEAVANLIASGELRRHIRKSHGIYAARRLAFADALRRHLSDVADFTMPEGGLAFWLQFRDEALLDRIDRFSETAELRFAPSTSFAIPPSRGRGLRLGFASLDEDEADRALTSLREVANSATQRAPTEKCERSADVTPPWRGSWNPMPWRSAPAISEQP